VGRFLRREAWVIAITALALVTRLAWNLVIHPPRNYVYSDMGGYFNRADDVVRQPLWATADYLSFFPWGTHAFLGAVKAVFIAPPAWLAWFWGLFGFHPGGIEACPRELKEGVAAAGCAPMDVAMALLGVVSVLYTTLLARRITRRGPHSTASSARRWVYVPIGLFAVVYYPFLAQGGFYMSEVPFLAAFSAATYHSVRLADEGQRRDALLFGLFAGLATIARPQMLMSVALLGVLWLFRRQKLPGATKRNLAFAGLPLALILAFSAIRTTRHIRMHDPHEFALVSTNDALNYAFGRCHPVAIEARTKSYKSYFGPPSLGSIYWAGKERARKQQWMPLPLSPAMPDDLACELNKRHLEKKEPTEPCIAIEGKMWSRDTLAEVASTCVAKTGLGRQLYYAFSHVVLNVAFNLTWPDSSQKLKKTPFLGLEISTGRPVMELWQTLFGALVFPFALIASILAFTKRRARDGLLSMHLWAAMIVGIVYFGDTRLRTPYDGVLAILAFDLMGRCATWIGARVWRLARV
jgi:hypothetical protein